METNLAPQYAATREGREAEAILRACVHCGFCTATCPTYQLLGDELDGPRGRIYLIKQVLEGATPTTTTQLHLDRCLTCRSCETTCPSGVRYGRLVDYGRRIVEDIVGRPPAAAAERYALRRGLQSRLGFGALLALGRAARPWLPRELAQRVPVGRPAGTWPPPRHARRMLALQGCVQPSLAPAIDAALARVLDRIGISLVPAPQAGGCCGALSEHLSAHDEAKALARRNVDAWFPLLDTGAEALIVSASGCGVHVRDYGHLLEDDPAYAERAAFVAARTRDPVEVIGDEWRRVATTIALDRGSQRVAVHPPCTLQHGLKLKGRVEELVDAMGHQRLPLTDAHLCCGSAGTYSILQPELASELRRNKLAALEAERPHVIVTANIGCMTHLAAGTTRPVRHWVELLDERMLDTPRERTR
ncbi:MAG: glycolate oxidase subunit GlcF [Proteobacteria bacterium]|nr:glycolate oxidase subunit GlcF [Pseudomonadota bacterium]